MEIAASFWEDERYDDGKICYQSLRIIDDLIDNWKSTNQGMSKVEKQKFIEIVNNWTEAINYKKPRNSIQKQLIDIINKYRISQWPLKAFSESMIYDINHNGFRTLPVFLRYAEGATVAPVSIFMHFCGIVKENDQYNPPHFDVRKAARPGALFCYLVHIIRDFQKDQMNNLNFFPYDLLKENGLSLQKLKEIAAGGEINLGFRNLMKKYCEIAEYYRCETRKTIEKISPFLEPRYRLSLEIIYTLYLQIFKRIDVFNGKFTTEELTPSPEEVKDLVNFTVSSLESTIR